MILRPQKGPVINYRRRGPQNEREGQVKFYPYKTVGGGGGGETDKVSTMLKGGGGCMKSLEVVLMQDAYILAVLYWGAKCFDPFKGGHKRFYRVLMGEMQEVSDPRFSHFVATPPPPTPCN